MTSQGTPNSRWYTETITTRSSDSSPTIIAIFESAKYIFGAGEATSRAFTQSGIGLRKTAGIFLSRLDVDNAGGLPGLLLSCNDSSAVPHVEIHGPENLDHLLASARLFTRRQFTTVTTHEHRCSNRRPFESSPIHEDENLIIYAVPSTPEPPQPESPPRLKRKRSRSPETDGEDQAEAGQSVLPPTVDWQAPDFHPRNLRGDQVKEWRRLVIQDMFRPPPGRNQPVPSAITSSQPLPTSSSPSSSSSNPPSAVAAKPTETLRERTPNPYYKNLKSRPPGWDPRRLPRTDHPPCSLSYICVGPSLRGKFRPAKAKALGVRPGPDFGKLVAGERVKATNGDWIDPASCVDAPTPPSGFAVIDCPRVSYVASLISSPEFQRVITKHSVRLKAMFHNLGEGVLDDPGFREWMRGFGPNVEHYIASPEYSSDRVTFAPSALLQLRLSRLNPDIFRLPHNSLDPPKALPADPTLKLAPLTKNLRLAVGGAAALPNQAEIRTFDFIHPSPESRAAEARLKAIDRPEIVHKAAQAIWEEYVSSAERARKEAERVEEEMKGKGGEVVGADIVVTALGTGSAIPSKYRNVSGTLLQIPGKGNILLDAGEGTIGQIIRRWGPRPGSPGNSETTAHDILRDLHCIFISHMHADHHLGLVGLLKERTRLHPQPLKPLYIIAPMGVRTYLHERSDLEPIGLDSVHFINIFDLILPATSPSTGSSAAPPPQNDVFPPTEMVKDKPETAIRVEELCELMGLSKVGVVKVIHRAQCFGLVIDGKDGWKVVFSGDTQPCNALVEAGQGATLLIHEATIDDDKPLIAKEKGHSTFGQAVDVAVRMKASHCLLTHFSQRYPKLPQLSSTPSGLVIAIAFDLMSVKVGEMWKLNHYLESMGILFREVEVGGSEADEKEKVVEVEVDVGGVLDQTGKGGKRAGGAAKQSGKADLSGEGGQKARKKRRKEQGEEKDA